MLTGKPRLFLVPLVLMLAMAVLVGCGSTAAPAPTANSEAVDPAGEEMGEAGMTSSGEEKGEAGMTSSGEEKGEAGMTPSGEEMGEAGMTPSGEEKGEAGMTPSGEEMGGSGMTPSGEEMGEAGMTSSGEEMGEAGMTSSGEEMGDEYRAMADDEMEAAETQALVDGWYRDRAVKYYDFGGNSDVVNGAVATAPIYVFVHGLNADGSPQLVEGQHNVVDVVPGEDGYSDLWQVMLVTVPEGYEPDSITSRAELDAAGFPVTATDMLVNCPIVSPGTILEGGEELVQGWNDGARVFYPDFGLNSAVAIPIWVFITGRDAEGNPQFVEGQRNVIDSVPGDPGYSAFWRVILVTVPEDYQPDSIRSAAEVAAAGLTSTVTDLVVNCPVTVVADA